MGRVSLPGLCFVLCVVGSGCFIERPEPVQAPAAAYVQPRDPAPVVATPSQGGDALCYDGCRYAGDGECDDGRAGAHTGLCPYGSDCTDCGPGVAASTGVTVGATGVGVDLAY